MNEKHIEEKETNGIRRLRSELRNAVIIMQNSVTQMEIMAMEMQRSNALLQQILAKLNSEKDNSVGGANNYGGWLSRK